MPELDTILYESLEEHFLMNKDFESVTCAHCNVKLRTDNLNGIIGHLQNRHKDMYVIWVIKSGWQTRG